MPPRRTARLFLLVGLSVATVSLSHAQKIKSSISPGKVPSWVHEAAGRAVPETDADIAWLHEELIVEPLVEGGVRETSRRVGKLLKRPGADTISEWGVVYSKEDEVLSFNAWTLLPDGSARRAVDDIRRGDILDLPVMASFSVYEDRRLRRATAPGVVVGAVVAHESVVVRSIDLGAASLLFGYAEEPTVLSRLMLRLPPGWGWEAARYRDEPVSRQELGDGVSFVAENLPPLPYEEQRPPLDEILPLVWLRWWSPDGERGFEDWNAVGRWEGDLAEPVLDQPGEATALAAKLKPSSPDRLLDAIGDAFSLVSRDIRYVSIQIGIGGYKPYSPAEVVKNGYGDCKDKSFLLRSFLEAWGLKSYPVLVRTRRLGKLLPEVPSPRMFNHMIAAVELPPGIGEELWATAEVEGLGRLLFLDGTVNQSDAWNLRSDIQGTEALVVHPEGGTLVTLPVQPAEASVLRREVSARIDDQGRMERTEVYVKCTGFDAAMLRYDQQGLNSEEKLKQRENEVQDWFPGASITDYGVEGLNEPERPVIEQFQLANGRAGKRVHELLIVEPGRMTQDFIGRRLPPPPRRWELRLEYPRTEEVEVRLELPPGWIPEELPAAMELRSEEISADCTWSFEEDVLVYRWSARLLTNCVQAERYEQFRKTVMRLDGQGAQPVVFIPAP